jgi:hypothetical protein
MAVAFKSYIDAFDGDMTSIRVRLVLATAIDEELGLMARFEQVGSIIQKYSVLLLASSFVDVAFECSKPLPNASAKGHATTSRPHNLL